MYHFARHHLLDAVGVFKHLFYIFIYFILLSLYCMACIASDTCTIKVQ